MTGGELAPRDTGAAIKRLFDQLEYRLALTKAALADERQRRLDAADEAFLRWVYEISGGRAKAEDALLTEIKTAA
jgi:hypothetical protein